MTTNVNCMHNKNLTKLNLVVYRDDDDGDDDHHDHDDNDDYDDDADDDDHNENAWFFALPFWSVVGNLLL